MRIQPLSRKLIGGTAALLLAAGAVGLTTGLLAQDKVSYTDLSSKITFDKSDLKRQAAVTSYADVLEGVLPAVVTIYSTKEVDTRRSPMFDDPLFRRFFGLPEGEVPDMHRKQHGLGSGVIITTDGYILTNNHVVEGADEIMVSLSRDQKDYEAKVVGTDPQTDVAVIKIEASNLAHATIGDSSKLRVGDVTLAIGNPFGLEQTVTRGIVSALGRSNLNITGGGYENFIQTDAPINQGNSGGALIDAQGRLVGINTAIQSGFGGGNIGIGFAIPVNMALDIVEELLDQGRVSRGFLGVYLKELDSTMAMALGRDDRSGVLVTEVGKDTPAETAGLKAGDLIVAYNGKPVQSMTKLRLDISNTEPGTEVTFSVVRTNKKMDLEVVLGDLEDRSLAMGGGSEDEDAGSAEPAKSDTKFLPGVEIGELDDSVRSALELDEDVKGVVVTRVNGGSLAAEAGLQSGHIITQVDQTDVASVDEAMKARKALDGEALLLQVYEGGRRDILAIRVEEE